MKDLKDWSTTEGTENTEEGLKPVESRRSEVGGRKLKAATGN